MSADQVALAVLEGLGLNVASSAIWDYVKARVAKGREPVLLQRELDAFLKIQGVTARASTVIEAFARKGVLQVRDSVFYAPTSATIGAGAGATFSFGQNSVSRTDTTSVHAQGDTAAIEGKNAAVVQRPDGSIAFIVGGSGKIEFKV
jgi:hypothetical protein